MICFAGFVPHSPLLIPDVAGENIAKLDKTIQALKKLEQDLYATKPDTLVIISSYHAGASLNLSINLSPQLRVSFRKFGDLLTDLKFKTDSDLAYKIKEASETKLPLMLVADEQVHYGAGVPLFHLAQKLTTAKIVHVNSSNISAAELVRFGTEINEQLNATSRRVAVIASGDLSHSLSKDSPKPYSPSGQRFDSLFRQVLSEEKSVDKLLSLDEALIKDAQQCALDSAIILLSVISDLKYQPILISYEAPFGIGYLVQRFDIDQ